MDNERMNFEDYAAHHYLMSHAPSLYDPGMPEDYEVCITNNDAGYSALWFNGEVILEKWDMTPENALVALAEHLTPHVRLKVTSDFFPEFPSYLEGGTQHEEAIEQHRENLRRQLDR